MALKATIQQLQQQPILKKRGSRKFWNHQPKRANSRSDDSASYYTSTRRGHQQFLYRQPLPRPSNNNLLISSNSNKSNHLRRRPYRSYKVEDPNKLNNSTNPTYKQQKDLLARKMYNNCDQQKTEQEHMFYVFQITKGKARDYLHTRQGPDSYDLFVDVANILEFLRQNFTNPNKVRKAKDAYTKLRQSTTLFLKFKTQFLILIIQY